MASLLLTVPLSACSQVPGIYVYAAEQPGSPAGGPAAFDPQRYVDEIWSSKIVPTVRDKALEVTTVAAAITKDPEAAGHQYGHQTATGGPYAFLVKGTGTVTKVDTDAPTGPVTVEVPAQSGAGSLTLDIVTGPVIAGTALRDGVGFISFGDFTNQIAYADVANQINARVKSAVTGPLDVAGLKGRKVTFAGAFSQLTPGRILLVPTEVEVVP